MRKLMVLTLCCLFAHLSVPAQSMQNMPGMSEMDHHHHDDEQLGHVNFPTSCAPASQQNIERGIALLHSFGYTIAQQQFTAIAAADPACAIAHWGIAMTQFKELWGMPNPDELKLGAQEMAIARRLAAAPHAATPRELAYIAALSAFFGDHYDAATSYQHRADAYNALMDKLHHDFPDDVEASAFDALAILASEAPDDTSLTHERRSLAILVPLFAANPDHPGLAHYIIHTCDTPALAADGLSAAREYARIAPSSPHALHMPGHIFARLGMWQEDIASNLASVAASDKAEAAGEPGAAHQMHAKEFLIYAYLQIGEDEKARILTDQMQAVGEKMKAMPIMDDMKNSGPWFTDEMHAIYAIEMHDWNHLANSAPVPGTSLLDSNNTFWAQGIAAGRLQNPALAAAALKSFDASYDAARKDMKMNDIPMLDIRRNEILAWQAYAQLKSADAVTFMRRAADQQDKLGQNEVDIPAREMLGDLLLLEHQPAAALAEYKVALTLSPNRLNGLLSAGHAADLTHQPALARSYYQAAAAQTNNAAHSSRADLLRAVHQDTVHTAAQ